MEKTINQRVKECIIERLNLRIDPEKVADDAALFAAEDMEEEVGEENITNLELDSIDALEIIVAIGKEFDVKIEDEDMHILQNLKTITEFVTEKLSIEK